MNRTPVADWQQLSALYERADTLDPASLADWLADLRRQPHPLLPQLEQMLDARSQVRSNGFLGTPPRLPIPLEPRQVDWHEGARIGPYRLLRRVGTGGMAEVWLAQRADGAFQRQVAIKLLFRHAGSSERDTFAQRFDRERDILASLNHPNIAGLHDAGVTPGGQPWLALEYVEGQSLNAWCDARKLTLTARVRLFRQVLLAVQHAHANLVIHRDLKPGNILVTEEGEVRLLDFGIAKLMEPEGGALAETELTRLAGRPMTPQYASPEQLMGQPLTTASDVYSLGVVLYELLCGDRPYELKVDSTAQLEQAILEMDPRPPSRRAILETAAAARGTTGFELRRQLANDLDAIVLRAMAKKPAQRYGSVDALGVDLDHWLTGEPVEARTPSTLYRAGKFVRRHTLAVGLSVGAVVALMVVTAVAVVMGMHAREDSARAVAARDFMLNIFRLADKEKSHGADITARELLETGRKDVLTRLVGQPRLQAELLRGIAKIQGDMGEYATADETFAELVRTCAALREPREQALAQIDRAWNALGMNRPDLAARLLRDAQAQADRPLADAEINAGLAQVTGMLSLIEGQAERARGPLVAARETAVRTLGENNLRTFRLGQVLVRADRDAGKVDDALALQAELRHTARQIGGLGGDEFANMDWEQVNLLSSAGRFDSALKLSDEVLPRCIQALGARAQMCRYLEVKRTQLLVKLGQIDQAVQDIPQLRTVAEEDSMPFLQIESLLVELRLRSAMVNQTDGVELASAFERVRKFTDSEEVQATLRAGAMLGLAESLLRAGDWANAQVWIAQSRTLLHDEGDQPISSRTCANARALMAISLLEQDQPEKSMVWLQPALRYFSDSIGEGHPSTQLLALNAALVWEQMGRIPEALIAVQRAKTLLRDSLGTDAPTYQRISQSLDRLKSRSNEGMQMELSPSGHARDAHRTTNVAREFFSF